MAVSDYAVPDASRILLTGASGYVGGRLLPALEGRGYRVRCLARRPEMLAGRVTAATEIVAGDVLDRASLDAALRGIDTAYYLVHSMGSSSSFEDADRQAARNFAEAAKAAHVSRIVYLGGLGNDDDALSPHLRSRQEVGAVLRASGVPVLEFRASIVIGSGSLSFEMIRSLVERLPIMITPRWVNVPAQPIAVDDVLAYLVAALQLPASKYRVYEIGGADQVTYADVMRVYAAERQLRIRMIAVPVLTPYLSSLWLGLVTPLYARIGRKLIESIVHPTVVRDDAALRTFAIRPVGVRGCGPAGPRQRGAAIRVHTLVRCAVCSRRPAGVGRHPVRLAARRLARAELSGAACGRLPAHSADWRRHRLVRVELALEAAWLSRSARGRRRHPAWTAVRHDPARGRYGGFLARRGARARPAVASGCGNEAARTGVARVRGDGRWRASTIRQTAIFDPVGLAGRAYWYALYPLHHLVFGGMLRGIVAAPRREAAAR